MAIRISGNTIISDTMQLQNIASVDSTTANTINWSIVNNTPVGAQLTIRNSDGDVVKQIYGASDGTP